MFQADSGWLHFLFADPRDHYYTGSIVRLDRTRYIYYHLKKKGYKGVFFYQDLRNGSLVRTEDRASADLYKVKAIKGFWQYVDASVTIETQQGREVYQIVHKDPDELRRRIIEFIKEPEDHYAFVFPIDVYYELYERNEDRLELLTAWNKYRQKSIFLIVANCRADASLGYLTDHDGVFGSSLGAEVEQLLKWKHRFVWYHEMKRVLKNRYNAWNQFRREDIERMIEYGGICENWSFDWSHLDDYVDFIYAWYHSSAFASCYPGMFPAKEKRSLDALAECLGGRNSRVWERMEQAIEELNKKKKDRKSLLHMIKQMYSINTDIMHPTLEESFEQRELADIPIEELLADGTGAYERQILAGRFFDVIQELRKPWSDGNVTVALQRGFGGGYEAESPVSYCAQMLSKLNNSGIASYQAVEKIVRMMEYCIGKGCEDRQFDPDLFDKKMRCRETIVRIAMEIAELQKSAVQCEKAISECEEEFQKMLQKAKANQMTIDPSITSVTVDMLLTEAQQKRVVYLDKEKTAKKARLAGENKKIVQYEQVISQFEETFERLAHNTLTDLPALLKEMTEHLKDHAVQEVIASREIDEALSDYEITQSEIDKYTEHTDTQNDYREQCRRLLEEEIQTTEINSGGTLMHV